MDLVCNQVTELQHVDISDYDILIERFAGPAIVQLRFTGLSYPGESINFLRFRQIVANLGLINPVKYWCCNLESERFCSHSKVCFEHLSDVHPARHTQWVQHNFNRRSIVQEWHVLFGDNLGDNAFVPVPACHLIADTQLALARDVDFNLLDDARIDVVAAFDAIQRSFLLEIQFGKLVFERADDLTNLVPDRARIDVDVIVHPGELPKQCLGNLPIGRNDYFTGLGVYDVERNLFAQEYVRERFRQFFLQSSPICFACRLVSAGVSFCFATSLREDTLTSMTMP